MILDYLSYPNQEFQVSKPAVSLPSTATYDQYIDAANAEIVSLRAQVEAEERKASLLETTLYSTTGKLLQHEYAQVLGAFKNFTFLNGLDGSPQIVLFSATGQSVILPFCEGRDFSARTEELSDMKGIRRSVTICFTQSDGKVKCFSVSEADLDKKVYSKFVGAGGIMRFGKTKGDACFLFSAFVNWLRNGAAVTSQSDFIWAKCERGWGCYADDDVLRAPLLQAVDGSAAEVMLDLVRVYGFLESRLEHRYRIGKVFNFTGKVQKLFPEISLGMSEKELRRALHEKQVLLPIHAEDPSAAKSFYRTQLARSNFCVVQDSVFGGRCCVPVLLSDTSNTLSASCLAVEYSENGSSHPSTRTFGDFSRIILQNPEAFEKVFAEAYGERRMKGDPDSEFSDEAAILAAVGATVSWFFSVTGEQKLSESLKVAFADTVNCHETRWDNFDALDIGEEIRNAIRNAVLSGNLKILDRLWVPEKLDICQLGFFDQNCLYIPERIFTRILSEKLPCYDWFTIRQYLDKAGVLLSNGNRWTAKISVKLDSSIWIQKRCLTLKLSFFNPAGKSNITNLRSKHYEKL